MDFFLSMAISVILTSIQQAVKNPEKAETIKRALIKVRNQIDLLYPNE